eukprot:2070007-Pyramimonas_sp.AAC.1
MYSVTRSHSGLKVLDLASGSGDPGIQIAAELPHSHVTITDASPPQIDLAIERSKGIANTECKVRGALGRSHREMKSCVLPSFEKSPRRAYQP